MDEEAQVLVNELNSLINNIRYNGRKVLEGLSSSFRMGDDNISYKDSRIDTVTSALGTIDLSKINDADDALVQIKSATDQINLELVNVNHNIDMIGRAMNIRTEEAENLFASAISIRIDLYDVVDDLI
ncbi:MAG: flagellin-like hook-associated protein FlgL [Chlamydiales bacterium]